MSKALFICSRSLDVMMPWKPLVTFGGAIKQKLSLLSYWRIGQLPLIPHAVMDTQTHFIHHTCMYEINFGFSQARGLQKLHWNEAIIWLNLYSLLKLEIMSNYLHLSALYEMSLCVMKPLWVCLWSGDSEMRFWASGDGILMCIRPVCVCGFTWIWFMEKIVSATLVETWGSALLWFSNKQINVLHISGEEWNRGLHCY